MMKRGLLGLSVAMLALGVGVSSAFAAGTPVKREIIIQLKKIRANPELRGLAKFKIANVPAAKKAIPELEALRMLLTDAGTAVEASSATTTAERTARSDWVSAVKLNASGVGYLASGLQDYVDGKKYEAQTVIDKGIKRDVSSNAEAVKAYKLLGIPLAE